MQDEYLLNINVLEGMNTDVYKTSSSIHTKNNAWLLKN